MPRLAFKGQTERYPADIDRIVRVCAEHGYDITRMDAAAVWEAESDSMAASWLFLPDDDAALLTTVLSHCDAEDGD